nr:hypothetical protein [Tanacetum cinerariifolium]
MGDEHLDAILETESDEFIKSSVENLVPSPSESEDKCECDVPVCDVFTTLSNLLFDIDSFLDVFAGELIILKSILPGIDEADSDPEEEIHLIEKLLYDNSSLQDILILEELLSNDSLSLPENDSFHFDIPSSPRPLAKPPDDDEIEPNSEILTVKKCALLRKKLKEVWFTICVEHKIFQDFLNTSESFNDNTNVINVPQEPFVFNQDPGENSSQSPPHIDHHCCYGCGDSLDDEFIKSSVENLVLNPSEFEDLSSVGTDCDPEEEIRLIEKLFYDNSSPRPSKETNFENSDAIIESFSPSPILGEDSDSLIEKIDLFFTSDDSMPPGIEIDDYDSEGDILFLEELLSNDSLSHPENKSFHFDVPSSPRPPAKPPDDDENEPDTGILNDYPDCEVFRALSFVTSFTSSASFWESQIAWILKTRARSFVLRSLDLHFPSFILRIQYPNLID